MKKPWEVNAKLKEILDTLDLPEIGMDPLKQVYSYKPVLVPDFPAIGLELLSLASLDAGLSGAAYDITYTFNIWFWILFLDEEYNHLESLKFGNAIIERLAINRVVLDYWDDGSPNGGNIEWLMPLVGEVQCRGGRVIWSCRKRQID